jgi:hypothetical protein
MNAFLYRVKRLVPVKAGTWVHSDCWQQTVEALSNGPAHNRRPSGTSSVGLLLSSRESGRKSQVEQTGHGTIPLATSL